MKLQKSRVKNARTISSVWIVPIIALVIALWLAFNSWQQKGTEIEIFFENASGIEVGKTDIRLKDVPIGKVTKVRLSSDLSTVKVVASLDRQVSDHLSNNSQFWLVTPRVSASGISNLGTLISGVYIVMDPGKPGSYQSVFQGLSDPPAVQSDDLGSQFVLWADTLGSLDIGSPIYYRQLKVGEVTGYRLGDLGNQLEIRIWVDAPHDQLVQTRSRFWNVSGLNVKVGAEGVKAEMASIASLIGGGIAFENTVAFDAPQRAPDGHQFYLYNDRDSVMEERYTLKYFYRLRFTHTVKGLSVGAPVEFRGIKVGEVVDVNLNSVDNQPGGLYVYISVEPQRLDPGLQLNRADFDARIADLVAQGMRAQMRTASMITGSKFIDLAFPEQPIEAEFVVSEKYSDIPTIDSPAEDLEKQIAGITTKINQIPLDSIGQELAGTLAQLNTTLATFNQKNTLGKLDSSVAEMEKTMVAAQLALTQMANTMESIDQVMSPDSQTQYHVNQTLQSLEKTANSLNRLLEQLNRKPDALIFGQ